MWEWYGTGMMGGGFMWLFWILIIFVIVLLIRAARGNSSSNEQRANQQRETPLEILEKRYARGEIDEEEFQRRKKELSG
jgi:putative membrane protein